jgi:hypothetical protein
MSSARIHLHDSAMNAALLTASYRIAWDGVNATENGMLVVAGGLAEPNVHADARFPEKERDRPWCPVPRHEQFRRDTGA